MRDTVIDGFGHRGLFIGNARWSFVDRWTISGPGREPTTRRHEDDARQVLESWGATRLVAHDGRKAVTHA